MLPLLFTPNCHSPPLPTLHIANPPIFLTSLNANFLVMTGRPISLVDTVSPLCSTSKASTCLTNIYQYIKEKPIAFVSPFLCHFFGDPRLISALLCYEFLVSGLFLALLKVIMLLVNILEIRKALFMLHITLFLLAVTISRKTAVLLVIFQPSFYTIHIIETRQVMFFISRRKKSSHYGSTQVLLSINV